MGHVAVQKFVVASFPLVSLVNYTLNSCSTRGPNFFVEQPQLVEPILPLLNSLKDIKTQNVWYHGLHRTWTSRPSAEL